MSKYRSSIGAAILAAALIFVALNVGAQIYLKSDLLSAYRIINEQPASFISYLFPKYTPAELKRLYTESWTLPFIYDELTQFREKPFKGKYVNVDPDGFRHVNHQGPWPPDPNNINLFIFGGSTTFGYGVADSETIPSQLQEMLNRKFGNGKIKVYNFGRGHYASKQELILFEKLLMNGHVPHVAIFIDGVNDFFGLRKELPYTQTLTEFLNATPL